MNLNFLPKSLRILILLFLFAVCSVRTDAQNILTEGFESTTFPPTGWINSVWQSTGNYGYAQWGRLTSGASSVVIGGSTYYPYVPTTPNAHGGSGMAWYNNWDEYTGSTAELTTKPMNFAAYTTGGFYQVSFWVYRGPSSYGYDSVSVYVNTSPTSVGGYGLGRVCQYYNYSPAVPSSGWYQYSYNIPASFNTATSAYIIFKDYSYYGYDILIDDVSVNYIAPCTGTPQAPLITSAALTVPLCSGGSTTINASDPNIAGSLYNFWQQSSTGLPGSWTNIPGTSSLSFTTPALTSTMYYRVADSCGISNQVNYSSTFTVPVNTYAITYTENFNTTLNLGIPVCFTYNVTTSNQSKWSVKTTFRDALGVAYNAVIAEDDVQGNYQYGKNAFFTLPALALNAGETYRIKFGYERGRNDATTTNGGSTYNENLQLFVNNPAQPSTVAQGSPGGINLFNTTITSDGHNLASLTFTPTVSGPYFFSWYSNTPHPAGGILAQGGLVAVDSIKIDSFGCNPAVISFQPQNAAVCLGSTATLNVTATGYGVSYQWYKNGSAVPGATSNVLTIPNAQLTDAGSYKVSVTGTCGSGNTVISNTVTLGVSTYPIDTVTTTTPTAFCAGGNVLLTANTPAGNSYQWKVNGNFIPNQFGSTYNATAAGSYQSVVTNSTGCATTSSPVIVTVLSASAVTVSPSGPTTFCNGGSVTLTANYNPTITYFWYNNNVLIPNNNTNVLTTSTPGSYTVQEIGANQCSVTFPTPINVVVNGPQTAPTITASGPLSFCLGGFVTMTTPTVNQPGYTYQWYQGANAINGATTTTYTASASGNYTVKVSQNNCTISSVVDSVYVDAPPASISNNGTIICSGNTIVLTATAGYTYQWLKNGTPISALNGGTNQVYSTNVGGQFQVQVTDAFPCTSTSSVVPVTVGAPPTAVILALGPTTFCPGGSVTIKANYDTSLNYIWNVSPTGLPGTYTALPPAHPPYGHYDSIRTFTTGGYVTVTEANGPCVGTSFAIPVTVAPVPAPTILSSGSDSLCPGGSVTLSTQTGTSLVYQWSKNGSVIPSAITANYVANSAGTYKVQVTNGTGCIGVAPPAIVSTFGYPADSIVVPSLVNTVCQGSTVFMQAPVSPGYQYQWRLNGQNVTGATQSTYSAGVAGSYTVAVTGIAGCVGVTPTPTNVYVLPLPPTNVFSATSTSFCSGGSVVLSAGAGAGLTYQWQYANPIPNWVNIPGATGVSYTDTGSGNYRVVVSNGACAVASIVVPVTVSSGPSVSIAPSGPTTVCQGNTVTLTATSASNVNYQWQKNGANITNATGSSYTAGSTGYYTVVATNNGCGSTSAPQQVVINKLPIDTVSLGTNSTNPTCAGIPAMLNDKNYYPGFTYTWKLNGGAVQTSASAYPYPATDSGYYSFSVTDTNGCTGSSTSYYLGVRALPNPSIVQNGSVLSTGTFVRYQWFYNGVAIPNDTTNSITISRSGNYKVVVTDGFGCPGASDTKYVIGVGVKNVNNNVAVRIYPNPATTIVHIEAAVKVNVTVSGLDGKVLMHENDATQIDLGQLANGVYMITVYDENNNVIKVDKLVKTGM